MKEYKNRINEIKNLFKGYEDSKNKAAMKTKEDKGAQYSKSIIDSFGIKGVPCGIKDIQQMIADGFIAGVNHIMSLPLASRLTAEEREKIRLFHNILSKDVRIFSGDSSLLSQKHLEKLESIFGKAMFAEKEEKANNYG